MSTNNKVESILPADVQTSLSVRFVKVASKSDKAPIYHAQVALPAPLQGCIIESPIFQSQKDGAISVALPGTRYGAILRAQKKVLDLPDGRQFMLSDDDEQGAIKIDHWEPKIKEAFLKFRQTGNAVQSIAF